MAIKTEEIELILEELLRKYGSYREAAKKLSVHEANLKSTLSAMSKKTQLKLADLGVTIDNSINSKITGGAANMVFTGKNKGEVKEENHFQCAFSIQEVQHELGKMFEDAENHTA